jgi:hypothetical protein
MRQEAFVGSGFLFDPYLRGLGLGRASANKYYLYYFLHANFACLTWPAGRLPN